MALLSIHIVVYVVLNALFLALWVLLGGGSVDELRDIGASPSLALDRTFWPIYPILVWGAAVCIHAGVFWSLKLFGRRERERRSRQTRQAARELRRAERARRKARDETEAEEPTGRFRRRRAADRQWVAVMFTDLVNSTPLAEAMGDEAFRDLIDQHRQMVRETVAHHDGLEVNTQGDGFLVRFASATDAVDCAVELQRRIADDRADGAFVSAVRIGLHAGEVLADDDDLIGRVINLASRVMSAAEAGEILVTEQIADHLAADHRVTDRGLVTLKGIPQPRHVLAVTWDDGVERVDEVIVLDDEAGGYRVE